MGSIYNSTDGPLIIDRAGRVLGAREHRDDVDVEDSPVAGHIAAGRIVIVDTSPADDDATDPEPEPAAPGDTPTPSRRRRSSTTTPQEG